jgi:putative glutamine amidotransferase
MKTVAITQRVHVVPEHGERRDCLDQAWPRFLSACGLLTLPLPNVAEVALSLFAAADIAGLVLSGGNDLAALGGDAPERDGTENALLDAAEMRGLPVLGVCRGMQVIQHRCAIPLRRVEGHAARQHAISADGSARQVNSYHRYAAVGSQAPLEAWAVADDGVVEAVRHPTLPISAIMWHPERNAPFAAADVELFRRVFKVA